jgi:hypothetical protein
MNGGASTLAPGGTLFGPTKSRMPFGNVEGVRILDKKGGFCGIAIKP